MRIFRNRIFYVIAAVVCILLIVWIWVGNRSLLVTEIAIEDSIPLEFDKIRIAQLSDFHNERSMIKAVEDKLYETDCDIIVITGDLIDSRNCDIDAAVELVHAAVKIAPCYYVNGNHEARSGENYYVLKEELEKAGVCVLENENTSIEIDGAKIDIIGLNDTGFDLDTGIEYLLSDAMSEGDNYKILLAHRPEYFEKYNDVDLVFSGHAHGGQFRLPFVGAVFAPGQGFFPMYYQGLFEDRGVKMVISRGIGNSLFPFRINNNPEILVVELRKDDKFEKY